MPVLTVELLREVLQEGVGQLLVEAAITEGQEANVLLDDVAGGREGGRGEKEAVGEGKLQGRLWHSCSGHTGGRQWTGTTMKSQPILVSLGEHHRERH